MSKDTLNLRAKNNARTVNEEVRRRDKGPNIVEKIEISLLKARRKQMVKSFEGFFKTFVEKGIPFKVRHTNIAEKSLNFDVEIEGEGEFNDNMQEEGEDYVEGEEYAGVPQEFAGEAEGDGENEFAKKSDHEQVDNGDQPQPQAEDNPEDMNENGEGQMQPGMDGEGDDIDYHDGLDEMAEEEEEELEQVPQEILPEFPYDTSKRMNYEDFISFYKEEIEGRLDRRKVIREREHPQTNEDEEDEKEPDEDAQNKNAQAEGEGADGEGEGRDDVKRKVSEDEDKEAELIAERENEEKLKFEQKAHEYSSRQQIAWKQYLEISLDKKFIVTEDNGYLLAVHPSPPIHDVLMLWHQDQQGEDDFVMYKDYGITERIENIEIPHELIDQVAKIEKDVVAPVSKVNTSQFNITSPLTSEEWKKWYDIILATKGHGYLQILPVGYKSNQPFKNNLLQILPKKEKEWRNFRIPLDTMINLREEYYKKENKRLYDENQKKKEEAQKREEMPMPLSEAEKEAEQEKQRLDELANEHIYKYSSKNIFRLSEYDFPH